MSKEGGNEKGREEGEEEEEAKSREALGGSREALCALFSLKAPSKPQTHGAEFPLGMGVAGGRGNLPCKRIPPSVKHTRTHTHTLIDVIGECKHSRKQGSR